MIKRIFAPIMLILVLISLHAFAESIPYTFGDITLPIPDTHYVLTRDEHDIVEIGLDNILSQYHADSLFESQPGLQMVSMRPDPFFEIYVSQLPMTGVTDFSKSAPEQLEECWYSRKDDLLARQVDLTEEIQIVSHPQTNFIYYAGMTEMKGSTVYISAYVTNENSIMTTIALATYDGPADESIKAVLDNIVQGSVLHTGP